MPAIETQREVNLLLIDDDPAEHLLLKRTLEKVNGGVINLEYVEDISPAIDIIKSNNVDIAFLDNRLARNNDFRETAPQLRGAGYVGWIGVISSDIRGSYFHQYPDFGVDFRIGKHELDDVSMSFIISEYTRNQLPESYDEDSP